MAAPAPQKQTPLAELLAGRMQKFGPMTFADYMRECLYHPAHGYYSRAETRRFADFYTSVDVHPIFARLLARQLAEMWEAAGEPRAFRVVEAGAGTGRLAAQILNFAERKLPAFYAALQYVAVEQSAGRRAAHGVLLERHRSGGRVASVAEIPAEIPVGCVLSNEMLDALPVHRVVAEDGPCKEIFVDWREEAFCELTRPTSTCGIAEYFAQQGISLRGGQQAEACLEACDWIVEVGRRLGRGFVLTIDYGHEAAELYNERHMRGTLLAYQAHRAGEDFYAAPGEQDLTAHVNFTALDVWGRRSGLERAGLVTQAQFLMALGRPNEFADLYEEKQPESERIRARLLLKNLIFPEGMGETFRVHIQRKEVSPCRLTGLQPL